MQINSAQDWLTLQKRRIVAKTYHSIPPPQSRRTNEVFLTAMANGVASAGECCLSNVGAPGTFATTTRTGVIRFNTIPAMSVTATRVVG